MKTFSFILLFFAFTGTIFSQSTASIFNPDEQLTWCGVDFSHAKYIGLEYKDLAKLDKNFFSSVNNKIIGEKDKFDFKRIFSKKAFAYDISMVDDLNKVINIDDHVVKKSADEKQFSAEDINTFFSNYQFKDISGLGLIIIVESLNRRDNFASMYLVFFDVNTKTILLQERMVGKPGGFGLVNYWLATINRVFQDIEEYKLYKWKNQYKK